MAGSGTNCVHHYLVKDLGVEVEHGIPRGHEVEMLQNTQINFRYKHTDKIQLQTHGSASDINTPESLQIQRHLISFRYNDTQRSASDTNTLISFRYKHMDQFQIQTHRSLSDTGFHRASL